LVYNLPSDEEKRGHVLPFGKHPWGHHVLQAWHAFAHRLDKIHKFRFPNYGQSTINGWQLEQKKAEFLWANLKTILFFKALLILIQSKCQCANEQSSKMYQYLSLIC